MPTLKEESIKELLKSIDTAEHKKIREDNLKRFLMFNGSIKPVVEDAIRKEFKKPETYQELIERIIPLNVVLKIIQKLSVVYAEPPLRKVPTEDELDIELMDNMVSAMQLNSRMKEANSYFKLYKANLSEIVLTEEGLPGIRNLPRHTYEVFSHSMTCPERPDTVMKYLNAEKDPSKQRLVWWTDEQHLVTDGAGNIMRDEMAAMDNPEGINPFGILPFVYMNSSTYSVNPIPNDDLLRMGIVIPLLLTDMAFAIKYLSWGVLFAIGAGEGDIPYSPNSIIHMEFGPDGQRPEIGTVRPELDIDGFLRYIETLTAILLTTNSLSATTISGQLTVQSAASGVAKALDSAESQEDKKDQQAFFHLAEKELWFKLSKFLMPYWQKNGELNEKVNRQFSEDFTVSIFFREPQVLISEEEKIKVSRMLLSEQDGGALTTVRNELQRLHPELDTDEIDVLLLSIQEDRERRLNEQVLKLESVQQVKEEDSASEETEVQA